MNKIAHLSDRAALNALLFVEGEPVLVTFERAREILGSEEQPVSTRHIERLCEQKKLRRVGRWRARRIVLASIYAYIAEEAGFVA
jgi:hypothetical protein